MEVAIIALVCLNLAFSVYQTRLLGLVIRNTAKELDNSLASAIQEVISTLPIGDFEPPNPFQQVLAQIIQDKMAPAPIVAKEVTRDDSGKFA
tara:strand:+ start:282 stop:557 length:276 start_codon:yes stop_codon:yes gene_type:complete